MPDARELREFVAAMPLVEPSLRRTDAWHVALDPPAHDFNRELAPPGTHPEFPDGAVGIRCDDDFWVCAVLPWRFRDVPLPEVVGLLWPDVAEPEFGPDVSYEPPPGGIPERPDA